MSKAQASPGEASGGFGPKWKHLAAGAALALAVLLLYWRANGYGFFHIDDESYIIDSGLTAGGGMWEALKAVFGRHKVEYWFPLTFLSYYLDSTLFGTEPGVYHRTNVVLFAANVFLAHLFLRRATGSPLKSLLAASLFAFHPMRVESVVWIAERKDVLSGVFFFLTLIFYVDYAKKGRRVAFALSLAFLTLGMMAKAILMVVPILMLLLDFWPLERFAPKEERTGARRKLLIEKAPFFAVALAFSALNAYLSRSAFNTLGDSSFFDRVLSLGVVYLHYLGNTFYPAGLTFTLADPSSAPMFTKAAALAALCAITGACVYAGRRAKAIAVGWLWFLVALLPASGLAKGAVGGIQAVADRFTYLPHPGLAVALVWGGGWLSERAAKLRVPLLAAGAALASVLAFATHLHIPHWSGTEAVGRHLLNTGGEDSFGHYLLAESQYRKGHLAEAAEEADKALRSAPVYREAWFLRGLLYAREGDFPSAESHFEKLLEVDPASPDVRYQLGLVAAATGRLTEARTRFQEELKRNGSHLDALYNLGVVSAATGDGRLAEESYRRALAIWPEDPLSNYNLGVLLAGGGRLAEAREFLLAALKADPANAGAAAWLESLPAIAKGGVDPALLPPPAPLATRRDDKI